MTPAAARGLRVNQRESVGVKGVGQERAEWESLPRDCQVGGFVCRSAADELT